MANPTKLNWKQDLVWDDGTPFTAADFAGYTIFINGQAGVSVPVQWSTSGDYSLPLANLAAVQKTGQYSITMTLTAKNGTTSKQSPAVTFSMDFRVPTAPSGLSVG